MLIGSDGVALVLQLETLGTEGLSRKLMRLLHHMLCRSAHIGEDIDTAFDVSSSADVDDDDEELKSPVTVWDSCSSLSFRFSEPTEESQ